MIQRDVMRAAVDCATSVMPMGKAGDTLIKAIAASIQAERDRCPGIVGSYAEHPDPGVAFVADEIAVAIRNERAA